MPPALLDATPLAGAHAARGIGAAVRGMLAGFLELPEHDRPRVLVRRGQEVPPGFVGGAVRWPGWRSYRVPDPWPALSVERAALRAAGGGVFQSVQPALVPRGRTVAWCFDLIPARLRAEYLAGAGRAGEALAHRRFVRRLAAAAMVVVPSGETAEDVRRIAGVEAARIRLVPLATPRAAAPAGPVPEGPYVLYAGAIEPHKNAPLALEAIARADAGVRLVMAGPWSARRAERLREHAGAVGASGRVEWLGYVSGPRLSALRAGALGVVVPSRLEGFGLPVLEALAAGVAALASDTPALREVGGDAATYLPLDDAAAWGRAISELAAQDEGARRARAARGRERAGGFTWERTARDLAAVWREVEAGGGRADGGGG